MLGLGPEPKKPEACLLRNVEVDGALAPVLLSNVDIAAASRALLPVIKCYGCRAENLSKPVIAAEPSLGLLNFEQGSYTLAATGSQAHRELQKNFSLRGGASELGDLRKPNIAAEFPDALNRQGEDFLAVTTRGKRRAACC